MRAAYQFMTESVIMIVGSVFGGVGATIA